MDNTNVVTLPTGNIDNDAYFDNLHLNNKKGSRKLANNLKIYLCLKSPRKTRPQEPKQPTQLQQPQQQGNIWKKEPFPSYANIVKSERPIQNKHITPNTSSESIQQTMAIKHTTLRKSPTTSKLSNKSTTATTTTTTTATKLS